MNREFETYNTYENGIKKGKQERGAEIIELIESKMIIDKDEPNTKNIMIDGFDLIKQIKQKGSDKR